MSMPPRPRPYPLVIRLLLGLTALVLIAVIFHAMTSLSTGSQFVTAFRAVHQGPGKTGDLKAISGINPNQFLYLKGTIQPASGDKKIAPLFSIRDVGLLPPSVFSDASGAVEIMVNSIPRYSGQLTHFKYNQEVHLLGTRVSRTGFMMFAIADSQEELRQLLLERFNERHRVLFNQGLLMALMVFGVFWLLNIIILSNPAMQIVQFLIVNLVFLVIYYSVLFISGYPLNETIFQSIAILGLANVAFAILSWMFSRLKRPS
jgi:hypothetical protein